MTRTVNIDHRRANREDLEEIQELFRVSINGLTMNHYTEAQRGAYGGREPMILPSGSAGFPSNISCSPK